MPEWFQRALESRTVRNVTLGTIGFLTIGACGGSLLANYTVAGMNALPERETAIVQRPADPDWSTEVARQLPDYDSSTRAEISDTSY
jgi:hypothetical protein